MNTSPIESALPVARVIMLDDDEDSRESFAAFLAFRGVPAEEFENAEDMLASIEPKGMPAVIVLDITLAGGMDGYEAARRLRSLPGSEKLRLIAVTGHSPASVRAKGELFDAILTKPVDPDEVVKLVRKFTT